MLAPQEIESVFLRPSSIASRRFTQSPHGYDPEEVHQYLEDVADYLSRLEGELEWRRARRTRQRGTIGEQREAISVVTAAREHAERILADARKEAEGFLRLARAIAHQLALEAQARRPQVALAVTRSSGSSTTVEGFEDFDDMEVWVDPSVFDLTKMEEPEAPPDVVASQEDSTAEVSVTEDAAAEVSVTEGAAPDASEDPSTSHGDATSPDGSASVAVAASDHAPATEGKPKKKSKKRRKNKS